MSWITRGPRRAIIGSRDRGGGKSVAGSRGAGRVQIEFRGGSREIKCNLFRGVGGRERGEGRANNTNGVDAE